MAFGYNNGYQPNMWQGYTPQTQQPFNQIYPVNSPYNTPANVPDIMTVNGENGAKSIQLPPNGKTMALDSTGSILWIFTADGAGYTTATPFTITPYEQTPPVDINSLENRIKKLEDIINEQSSVKNVAKQSKSKSADNAE